MNHRTILVAFGLAFGPSLASAIPIEYTFTANGVTDGASQQATADVFRANVRRSESSKVNA